MVVFGGNGFVGRNVCQAAVRLGAEVVSVSRSGAPGRADKKWADGVRWVKGDIFKPADYAIEVREEVPMQAGHIYISRLLLSVVARMIIKIFCLRTLRRAGTA